MIILNLSPLYVIKKWSSRTRQLIPSLVFLIEFSCLKGLSASDVKDSNFGTDVVVTEQDVPTDHISSL